MNNLIYYTAIILACIWIIIYGSVYETQYHDLIYLYGDELLVILALIGITYSVIQQDFVMGLLLFLIVFFITNDVSIIHNALDEEKHKEGFQLSSSLNNTIGLPENVAGKGVKHFVNSVSNMNILEENMEGLLGSLHMNMRQLKNISL